MNQLTAPQGSFTLQRFPRRAKETLRAWDAADELLLDYLASETNFPEHPARTLILNDNCGALSVALAEWQPVMLSDSFISHQATRANLEDNGISQTQVRISDCLEPLENLFADTAPANLVLIKITKSLAQLEDQLHRLRPWINQHTRIISGGMVKAIHSSTLELFEKIIGPTQTSLAKKKARLIHCQPDQSLQPAANPFPKQLHLAEHHLQIINHANVFARDKLDIGTRFFLDHMPASDAPLSIIDLGCGNGLLGIAAARKNPNARLTFADESFMAVASAATNFQTNGATQQADFSVTDCLQGIDSQSADLILNNPPFHQQNAIGDFIAVQMFKDAKRCLKAGGKLLVIGNRHLGYHVTLKRLFNNCTTIASNKKFVILQSIKNA